MTVQLLEGRSNSIISGRSTFGRLCGWKEVGVKGGAGFTGADDCHQIFTLESVLRVGIRFQLVVAKYADHRDPGFFPDLRFSDGVVHQDAVRGYGHPFKVELLLSRAKLGQGLIPFSLGASCW